MSDFTLLCFAFLFSALLLISLIAVYLEREVKDFSVYVTGRLQLDKTKPWQMNSLLPMHKQKVNTNHFINNWELSPLLNLSDHQALEERCKNLSLTFCILIFKTVIFHFIYLIILTALGFCCCAWAFSSCHKQGPFAVLHGLLVAGISRPGLQ